jgi:WD40 repeat protein
LVELYSPRLVASSSLDGKIKLWDIADRSLMTELKSPNSSQRGIRGLTYNYEYGSNLLSYGFEMHINVWCPEVSITRAFIGKLEGHSSLIVMCKFIAASPNCISVDDRTNIRIWDIRTMSTVQVLASEQASVVTGLCVITRSDKFVITGKRLTYYKNGAVTTTTK